MPFDTVDNNATDELLNEIEGLKAQIIVEKSEKQRLNQLLVEKAEDVDAARCQASELHATVKVRLFETFLMALTL